MSNDAEIAKTFYGAPTPPAKPESITPAAKSNEQSTADALFGASMKPKAAASSAPANKNVDVQSDADMAKVILANSPIHGNALRSIETAAQREHLATPEQASEIANAWLPMMQEYDLNATESAQLADLGVSMTLNPASEEHRAAWRESSLQALRQDHGDRAGAALAAAQKMIAADKTLSAWLDETGLGSHPSVVRAAAAKALARSRK